MRYPLRFPLLLGALAFTISAAPPATKPTTNPSTQPQAVRIDMDRALKLPLPEIKADLKPVSFKTSDGKEAWVLRIPGNRPIATPAYADGLIFVGGGYGSHEFYAFDAATGTKVWRFVTSRYITSSPAVANGVVFVGSGNGVLYALKAATGHLLWSTPTDSSIRA